MHQACIQAFVSDTHISCGCLVKNHGSLVVEKFVEEQIRYQARRIHGGRNVVWKFVMGTSLRFASVLLCE